MSLGVNVINSLQSLNAQVVWELLQQNHRDLLSGPQLCRFCDTICSLDDVSDLLRSANKQHFEVSFPDNTEARFSYGHIQNRSHTLLWIEGLVSDVRDAERWAEPFLQVPGFRQAWVYDSEYNYWQNAEDALLYTAAGRSCQGLPMKSNGKPFPLTRDVIDISQNPGRRIIQDGYVEVVAAIMWLGRDFWSLSGARRDTVLDQDWLSCDQLDQGVLRVQTTDSPFSSADGESGRLQERLRCLLFPESSK